jgi:lipoprotein Spr
VDLARGTSAAGLSEKIVDAAKAWLGVPYFYGGTSFAGVDCSALVQKIYQESGIELPRTSQEQFRMGVGVPRSQLRAGDLVFFSTSGPGASHVGIYIGNQEFVSATRNYVEIQSLDQDYWNRTYRGSRRVIP